MTGALAASLLLAPQRLGADPVNQGQRAAAAQAAGAVTREARIDRAVRNVMAMDTIRQGYMGTIAVNRAAVRVWWDQGAPLNAWWWAFCSAAQAQYRRLA